MNALGGKKISAVARCHKKDEVVNYEVNDYYSIGSFTLRPEGYVE